MEHMDDIIRARETIRKKYNALRRGEAETELELEKTFKPVAEPLKALLRIKDPSKVSAVKEEPKSTNVKEEAISTSVKKEAPSISTEEGKEDGEDVEKENVSLDTYVRSNFGPLAGDYFYKMIKAGGKGLTEFDHVSGVRHGGSTVAEWMIGSKPVSFDKTDTLLVNGEPFTTLTPGLLELIFKRAPRNYAAEDLTEYKRLLDTTNAHRVNYDADQPLRATRAKKYTQIIKTLYPKLPSVSPVKKTKKKKKTGAGAFVPLEQKRTYVYWDDPNELVERLALLVASKEAGNTGLEREILSIEEELREGGYIR